MDDADSSAVLAVRPPSFMVMAQRVVVHGLTNPGGIEDWPGLTPGKGWSSVYCARKNAYGCGRQGQKLVEGLSLHVRSGYPYLNTQLSICLSGEAVRCAEAELGTLGELEVDATIRIAHQQVIVVLVGFLHAQQSEIIYYLVYDSTDASLYMVPYLPATLEAIYTATPVPVRAAGCWGHELAMLARERWPCHMKRGVLCLSTRESRASTRESRADGNPWEMKPQEFPDDELPQPFSADVLFSVQGKVFWADLSQGLVYSDLVAVGDAVECRPVLLPTGFQIEYPDSPDPYGLAPPMKAPDVSRTMGSVDGSIKLVCINDGMVKVLTLDLDNHRWKDEKGFPCPWIELWKQLVNADADLRNVEPPLEPQHPILMPNGALCLLLCDAVQGHKDANYLVQGCKEVNYICSFDMRTRNLLTLGRVEDYETTWPVILPSDFFRMCNTSPPPPLRKKLRPAVQAMPLLK